MEQDDEIVGFLRSKGLPISNHAEFKRFLEENIFLVGLQALVDGKMHTNYPGSPQMWLSITEVLDYPTKKMVDVAYSGEGYFKGGFLRSILHAGLFRDGVKTESLSGYNWHGLGAILGILDSANRILERRAELFPPEEYPRLLKDRQLQAAFKSQMKIMTLDGVKMSFGDGGRVPFYKRHTRRYGCGDEWQGTFLAAYLVFRDPEIGWAAAFTGDWRPPKDFPYRHKQFREMAKDWRPDWWGKKGDILPGYGLAVLRSGENEDRRALYCRFGKSGLGHAHDDTMSLCLDAFQSPIIRHWGYPPRWHYFYRSWMTQNTGRHFPLAPKGHPAARYEKRHFDKHCYLSGSADLLFDAPPIHVSDAFADLVYDRHDPKDAQESRYEVLPVRQRRINVLVETPDGAFYGLDLYRIRGGEEHWRTLNTLDGSFSFKGIDVTEQTMGTLAGENVAYNDEKWMKAAGLRRYAFALLDNVKRGRSAGGWQCDWAINNSDGLKMRLHVLDDGNAKVAFCDARDPSGAHPDLVRKFVAFHHAGTQGTFDCRSQVFAALEGSRGEPVIQEAERLPVTGDDENGFGPVGCAVCVKGRTDYFILSADGTKEKRLRVPGREELVLNGRIGYLALDEAGEVVHLTMIEGTRMRYGDHAIHSPVARYRGQIAAMDPDTWNITVAPPAPEPEGLLGKYIYVCRGGKKIGFEIKEAWNTPQGTTVEVNYGPQTMVGQVAGVEDFTVLGSAVDAMNRDYHQVRLVNEKGDKEYVLDTHLASGKMRIDATKHPEATADQLRQSFPIDSIYGVYDYGVGDEVEIPLDASPER